jgi:RNA-directed DNA polymerase
LEGGIAYLKTIRNIYPQIYDFENLHEAYLSARKNKRYRGDVLEFTAHLEENLIQLQNELIHKTYRVGRYREFYVYEPKKRLIMALQFRDRVIQWAIYRHLNPWFDKQFIYDSYGCREGKGTHRAADRLQYWVRQVGRRKERYYYLKLDISKYFYRVDHKTLMDILRRKIEDEGLLGLLDKIINCEHTAFGLPAFTEPADCPKEDRLLGTGMPIGNLSSQLFANIYLNELDQYVKQELRIHYYIRYMDDMIILHHDKRYLHEAKDKIETFLWEKLKLNLNKKTAIRPISQGIEFVGYRIFPTHRKLKKASAKKMKARLKYVRAAFERGEIDAESLRATEASYMGVLKHFNSHGLRKALGFPPERPADAKGVESIDGYDSSSGTYGYSKRGHRDMLLGSTKKHNTTRCQKG